MALPTKTQARTIEPDEPINPPVAPQMDTKQSRPSLTFEDVAEMPGAVAANMMENPFQAAVNQLADTWDKTGKQPAKVVRFDNEADVKWARSQISQAARNVNHGAKTKVVMDGSGWKVYFVVGNRVTKPRKP